MSAEDCYKPGQLTVHYHDEECTPIPDGGCDDGFAQGDAYLPSQGDEWLPPFVIGGPAGLLALRSDIDAALTTIAAHGTAKPRACGCALMTRVCTCVCDECYPVHRPLT